MPLLRRRGAGRIMTHGGPSHGNLQQLAAAVREACVTAAREGYERAALAGLCHEGAMEASLDAIRALDLDAVLTRRADPGKKP